MQHGYGLNLKNVLLCGYFGYGNMGDEAALQSALALLGEYGVSSCVAYNPTGDFSDYLASGATRCNRFSAKEIKLALMSSDALVLTGGNLIQNETSERSLLYYSAITALAERFGKPVYMLSSGVGSVRGYIGERFMRRSLRRVSFAGLRTDGDIDECRSLLGCTPCNMPDLAFAKECIRRKKSDSFAIIPKTASRELIIASKRLKSTGLTPVVIPLFPKEDLAVSGYIGGEIGCEVFVSQNVAELSERLALCKFCLTERLHGSVFSVLSSTPYKNFSSSEKCMRFTEEMKKRAKKLDTPPPVLQSNRFEEKSFSAEKTDYKALADSCAYDLRISMDKLFNRG